MSETASAGCVIREYDDGYPAYCIPHAQEAATCSGRFQCGYADAGQDRCPEWRCDCFIEQFADTPQELHPEAFVVGPPPTLPATEGEG